MIYLNEKKIAVIGIDHGYGNIKTANTITPTAITEYDTEPVFSGNILEYGGKYYRIGEGHKEFIVNKAMDEDFYLLTLMGVACELNRAGMREADVHLAAGLPLTWVRKQRESFREYLLHNERVEYKDGMRLGIHGTTAVQVSRDLVQVVSDPAQFSGYLPQARQLYRPGFAHADLPLDDEIAHALHKGLVRSVGDVVQPGVHRLVQPDGQLVNQWVVSGFVHGSISFL